MNNPLKNWAGNLTYQAQTIHAPTTIAELQQIVRDSPAINAIGSRHSFSPIADSPGALVSLTQLPQTVDIDRARQTVTVSGGMRYGDLATHLVKEGLALHNLASLPHISVVGACATATHGSGVGNGNLATAVVGLDLITADGERRSFSMADNPDALRGAAVNVGALGIVTHITLALQPHFEVAQRVYRRLPFAALADHLDEILSSAYSVSLFTSWQHDFIEQVWLKEKVSAERSIAVPSSLFGASPAEHDIHPVEAVSAESCTAQLGIPGPWHERLPHFRLAFTPSKGEELQTEYFIPRHQAVAALQAVHGLREQIAPLLYITEVRAIAADELWLSPCYQQDCVALHFTWKPLWPQVQQLLPRIEAALQPFAPRPHWGKLFTLPPAAFQSHFPRLADFRGLARQCDPNGKFRNPFLAANIF